MNNTSVKEYGSFVTWAGDTYRDGNGPGRARFILKSESDLFFKTLGPAYPVLTSVPKINDSWFLTGLPVCICPSSTLSTIFCYNIFLIKLLHNQLIISLVNDFSFLNIISLEDDYCI
jgi:hypothetical protein